MSELKNKERKKKEFKLRIYKYTLRLLKFCSKLPKTLVIGEINKQLIRSGTSIGANFFEAEAGSSIRDFQNFLAHSLKSANETKFWLALLRDSGLLSEEFRREGDALLQETKEIANILAASIITMKKNRQK